MEKEEQQRKVKDQVEEDSKKEENEKNLNYLKR
jgi:hypothetical protein